MSKLNIKSEGCFVGILLLCASLAFSCRVSEQSPAFVTADRNGDFYKLAVENRFEDSLSVDLVRGKEIFQQYCAICHGESGDGNGFNAYNLKSNFGVQPFDFTDSTMVAELTFESVQRVIASGGTGIGKSQYMPPWGKTLNGYELHSLSSYLWDILINKETAK
ncbi:MAG: c-type cytochrome [bacterium]